MPVDTNPDDVSFDLDVPIGPDEAAKLLDGLEVVVVPRGRPLTDTGYRPCRRGTWISEIGITYNIEDSHYSTIHIVPTPRARGVWGILNPDLSESARATYEEVIACLILLRFTATVLSWDAIYQQIACHMGWQHVGGGPTWDVEGHRDANPVWWPNTAAPVGISSARGGDDGTVTVVGPPQGRVWHGRDVVAGARMVVGIDSALTTEWGGADGPVAE